MVQYWYNIATKQVEEDRNHSRKQDLLGPYPTRAAAEAALTSTAAKTKQWEIDEEREAEERARTLNRDPDEPGLLG